MTHSQRFDVQTFGKSTFAALTLGCPSMIMFIDRDVFKKTMEEKWKLYNFRKQIEKSKNHKFKLIFQGSF